MLCDDGRMQIVTVETDAQGAASLAAAAQDKAGIEFGTRELQAQVGDPDTWMFVAQMADFAVGALSTAVLALIKQRKIKYIKVGDQEFRDITPGQLKAVQSALSSSRDDQS